MLGYLTVEIYANLDAFYVQAQCRWILTYCITVEMMIDTRPSVLGVVGLVVLVDNFVLCLADHDCTGGMVWDSKANTCTSCDNVCLTLSTNTSKIPDKCFDTKVCVNKIVKLTCRFGRIYNLNRERCAHCHSPHVIEKYKKVGLINIWKDKCEEYECQNGYLKSEKLCYSCAKTCTFQSKSDLHFLNLLKECNETKECISLLKFVKQRCYKWLWNVYDTEYEKCRPCKRACGLDMKDTTMQEVSLPKSITNQPLYDEPETAVNDDHKLQTLYITNGLSTAGTLLAVVGVIVLIVVVVKLRKRTCKTCTKTNRTNVLTDPLVQQNPASQNSPNLEVGTTNRLNDRYRSQYTDTEHGRVIYKGIPHDEAHESLHGVTGLPPDTYSVQKSRITEPMAGTRRTGLQEIQSRAHISRCASIAMPQTSATNTSDYNFVETALPGTDRYNAIDGMLMLRDWYSGIKFENNQLVVIYNDIIEAEHVRHEIKELTDLTSDQYKLEQLEYLDTPECSRPSAYSSNRGFSLFSYQTHSTNDSARSSNSISSEYSFKEMAPTESGDIEQIEQEHLYDDEVSDTSYLVYNRKSNRKK